MEDDLDLRPVVTWAKERSQVTRQEIKLLSSFENSLLNDIVKALQSSIQIVSSKCAETGCACPASHLQPKPC